MGSPAPSCICKHLEENGKSMQTAGPAMGGRVLVVEDDHDARGAISDLLVQEGHVVVACCNGQEAIDELRAGGRQAPDVLCLDLRMPGRDARQFRLSPHCV